MKLASTIFALGLAAVAWAEPPETRTPLGVLHFREVTSLSAVQVKGAVTYSDPALRTLIIQDGDHGLYIQIPSLPRQPKPGEQVEVQGTLRHPGYLDADAIHSLGPIPLPPAVSASGANIAAGQHVNCRVSVGGVVRRVEPAEDHAILHLMADRQLLRARVLHPPADAGFWNRFVDAEVRVQGVAGPFPDHHTDLLIHSLRGIQVTRPASPSPFDIPSLGVADLPAWGAHRVRVSGEVVGPVKDGVLTLDASGTRIRVAVHSEVFVGSGERVDAVGFPDRRDDLPFLAEGLVRVYAPARKGPPGQAPPLLPVLQSIEDLRHLTLEECRRGYAVRLKATVTYHDPAENELFLHDGSLGIFAYPPPDVSPASPGSVVLLEGYSDPGEFAPSVQATRLTRLAGGPLPVVRRYGYERLLGGREDCQWVEIEAVVRGSGWGDHGEGCLMLRYGPETTPARIAGTDPASLGHLTGATVRVQAVCGSRFNARRQWQGLMFYVPGPESIEVIRPPATELTSLPTRTVESLSLFDPERFHGEAVRLSGRIISRRGSRIMFQDATGGGTADLQPRQPGAVGDRVDVQGFLVRGGQSWRLEDAQVNVLSGNAEAPGPRDVSAAEVAAGNHSATLVRLEGILVDQFPSGDTDHVILLRSVEPVGSAYLFFPAVLQQSQVSEGLNELRPGSRLRVTGACAIPTDQAIISAFRIYLRESGDVEVIDQPGWWTPRKAMGLAGLVGFLAVLVMAWVVTLRRRVNGQTAQIRQRLEREAQLEARYRELFETASDAVFTLDATGAVTDMNPAGEKLTGLKEGSSFLEAVSPKSAADARQLVECTVPVSREVELASGSLLEVNTRPLLDGRVSMGVQAIARDLTQRRRLEEELRQAQKMEAVGRLAGGIAHDFNNLLTVINGSAEMLRSRSTSSDRALAEEILVAGEHAASLTRQLLAFSRKGVITPRVLCPNDSITRLKGMLSRLVGERVYVATDLDERVGHIRIDAGQMEQVLVNLAVNARDAMPQGGTLTIRTLALPHQVRIEVIDTGIGMDSATRGRVFEPFFTTKPAGEGTGLGLATLKGIVDQTGGTVRVQSEVGRGTTFIVEFPLCEEQPLPPTPVPAAPSGNEREVILLVEDEPAVQLLERRVLEMGRYEVLVASCGEEALTLLDDHLGRIDLLITDVVMPGMSGRELAEAVARLRPGLPALFLSGYTPDEVLRQGVRAEGTHFLQKPFTPSSLLGKVQQVLTSTA